MTWVRRGQRLVRVAAAAYRGGQAVATPRLLSAGPTLIPSTSVPLSPAVRYLVDTNSLDPSLIPASGPHSRLLKGDVLWYMETGMDGSGEASSLKPTKRPPSSTSLSPPSSLPPSSSLKPSQPTPHTSKAKFTDVAVDDSHRSRAFTSVQSKMSLPHSSASIHCQVGPLLSSLQHNGRERAMLLLESHFIKAAASTLKQFPHSNAVWNEDGPLLLPSVNISVRVLSEGILLPTPVIIRDANRASVQSIASVIERATAGTEDGSSPPVTSASLMYVFLRKCILNTVVYVQWNIDFIHINFGGTFTQTH
ncbi:Pyruvate dehydrogenase protein X component, mitochondrial [Geodia barretti]|uniref:Pyruvate dehydrogenase protein X component, mitochondrial n=1 Tax=Geodia barretti TaxID=519541 RepID=A0AA35SGL8_GEOBA|nr:Pyruvate dehydrogenase protein X component, mitochondrial [Geodia barretti]